MRRRRAAAPDGARDRRAVECEGSGIRDRGSQELGKAIRFTLEVAQDSIQRKVMDFDPTGDAHYDIASAFIKSMRGSDPDAAIYWLARMLEAGEDPRFHRPRAS